MFIISERFNIFTRVFNFPTENVQNLQRITERHEQLIKSKCSITTKLMFPNR